MSAPILRSPLVRSLALLAAVSLFGAASSARAAEGGDTVAPRHRALWEQLRALGDAESESPVQERFARFLELSFERALLESPEFGIYIGDPRADVGRWSDRSLAAVARRQQEQRELLTLLRSMDRSALRPDSQLDYDLFERSLSLDVAGAEFPQELLAITQLGGIQQDPPRLFAVMAQRTVADFEAILARLTALPEQIEQTRERLERGRTEGVMPPALPLRDVPAQIDGLVPEDPWESALLSPFQELPQEIPGDQQEPLRESARRVYLERVAPAYRELRAYLSDVYLPACRQEVGMSALPNGAAWYAYNSRRSTTTDLTPEQIHEIGLSEVARIRAEMDAGIERAGFTGTFAEWSEFLRSDPRFFHESEAELLAAYRDIAKRVDAELLSLFSRLPSTPYGVSAIPAFMAEQQPTAYYQSGSLEAGRAGIFYANTSKLETRPKWEMQALTLHEAVPGHHLQIALQQELGSLPWFRRHGGYTAFSEGWGLYAEGLGEELGMYQDPYDKYGQLTYEMWRAVRLVVDTGIHALGWSRQRAIDYFSQNTSKSLHDIEVEIDRYIVWPGQALAYKIGQLKIQELRERARKELGDRFDVRRFHDQVLARGALPLSVLETVIDAWIASEQTDASATATGAP